MKKNSNLALLIIRLSVGVLLLLHGIAKLQYGIPFITGMMEAKGLPGFFGYAVYLGEVLGPLMLIIGYRSRIGALLVGINMLVIMFLAHAKELFSISQVGGWAPELAGLYLFGALAIFVAGGGSHAVSSKNKWD
jgi:putative oxidoreductase